MSDTKRQLFSKLTSLVRNVATVDRVVNTPAEVADAMRVQSEASGEVHNIAAVYACVRLLSETIASLPAALMLKSDDESSVAAEHPVHKLLSEAPNSYQTPFDFVRFAVVSMLYGGNFYANIVRRGDKIDALLPLFPQYMSVEMAPGGALKYVYRQRNGTQTAYQQREIMHVRCISTDTLVGIGPIEAARRSLMHTKSMHAWNQLFFKNAIRPAGVLKHKSTLSAEAFERLRSSFDQNYSGEENAHKPLILEEDMGWESLSMSAEDAQFIDTMKFTRAEIAMFFSVPPHMIGDIERGTSWGSGLEQQNLGFLTYTIKPILINIGQAAVRDLLPENDRGKYNVAFDTSDLTRADFNTRQSGLEKMRKNGVISSNEWRRIERMNPREGGDEYTTESSNAPAPNSKPGTDIPAPEIEDNV